MCKWGNDTMCSVEVSEDLSHTGGVYFKLVGIDSCIAPLVEALNNAGIKTRQSCCGHGKTVGSIELNDGRILRIITHQGLAG